MAERMNHKNAELTIPCIELLRQTRRKKGISQATLSRGICTVSALSRYENGTRIPSSLMFFHLVKRLGLAPSRFAIMISETELSFYEWRWAIQKAILRHDWEEADRVCHKAGVPVPYLAKPIQDQLLYYVQSILAFRQKGDRKCALYYLKKSIECTIPAIETKNLQELALSSDEIMLLLYEIYLKDNLHLISKSEAELAFGRLTAYLSKHITDEAELARVYPKLVCVKLNTLGNAINSQEQIMLCKKAKALLDKSHGFFDLAEILRILIYNLAKENQQARSLKKQYERLKLALETNHFDNSFQPENLHLDRIHIYLISECLYSHRMKSKLTQEDTSRGICSAETFSRIETGKRRPSISHLRLLSLRLRIKWIYYNDSLETADCCALELKAKIKNLLLDNRLREAADTLRKLKDLVDMEMTPNLQYIGMLESYIQFKRQEITPLQYYGFCSSLLKKSLNAELDNGSFLCLTQTEAYLQIAMSLALHEMGRQKEGIYLLERLLDHYEKSKVGLRFCCCINFSLFSRLAVLYYDIHDFENSLKYGKKSLYLSLFYSYSPKFTDILSIITQSLQNI